jgi:hypothetical protein
MRVEEFVAALRARHIDRLLDVSSRAFAERPLSGMRDAGFRELARYWKSVDEPTQRLLAEFIRLGSQNTMASLLAALDNTSSEFAEKFRLVATAPNGDTTELSSGLLDTFWEQEEAEGHVNRAT